MTNEREHKPNDFTPVVGAMNLADYVMQITDNPNKFPDYVSKETRQTVDGRECIVLVQRQDSLTNVVRHQSMQIYLLAFTANEINLKRQPWRKDERLGKQAEAIRLCDEHLASIMLCRKHFHLSTKRIKHWGGMTRELRSAIDRWHESDKDRYKNI